jgi:hypothetical protein
MRRPGAVWYYSFMETFGHCLIQITTMNHPLLAFWDGYPSIDWLIAIFALVTALVLIKNTFRIRQSQLWHETARAALEKGQPVPQGSPPPGGCTTSGWYCGLIWIAAGVGLWLVNEGDSRNWAALPICVGAALLVASLISTLFQPHKT